MMKLSEPYIKQHIADSLTTFKRGQRLYDQGVVSSIIEDFKSGFFTFEVDGNYGDYLVEITLGKQNPDLFCDCPYPSQGCKHLVASLLKLKDVLLQKNRAAGQETEKKDDVTKEAYLTKEDIKTQALIDRKKRAKNERFVIHQGDTFKGEHTLKSISGKTYTVTLHDPERGMGHCNCPDYLTNRLKTCKHLIHLTHNLQNSRGFEDRVRKEFFPFLDVFWNSDHKKPEIYYSEKILKTNDPLLSFCLLFQKNGLLSEKDFHTVLPMFQTAMKDKRLRVQDEVINQFNLFYLDKELEKMADIPFPPLNCIHADLYPYQVEGVRFSLFRKSVLIGDDMGLGKTLQAITASILKKEIFGFRKVLVITVASLKEQWKREISKFTDEESLIIAGSAETRDHSYTSDTSFFKITNYEAILRDIQAVRNFEPDIVILDEAQRIKNFKTKTADAVKSIPRKHAMVLTGTPLENRLEDLYSIIQFLDPGKLSPLWEFAGNHFIMSRDQKGKILGYKNQEKLNKKLNSIIIRRKKEDVLKDLPKEITNNYFIDLSPEQSDLHNRFADNIMKILTKSMIAPMEFQKIQNLLMKMRQVCNAVFLVDKKTKSSPKLKELAGILDEIVLQSGRKAVIFSEWISMNFLISNQLSHMGIPFVEISGKIPLTKRQQLIDEFTTNPECRVFLSTDAGGTGLNLQVADCVINVEPSWNPEKQNQRLGRISRIGQKSSSVNIINLISKDSLEEKILTDIQEESDLFRHVFDRELQLNDFSDQKKSQLLNQLRNIMGASPDRSVSHQVQYFKNPEVFGKKNLPFHYDQEEDSDDIIIHESSESQACMSENNAHTQNHLFDQKTPEQIEQVLNSGMNFLGGLMEIATGKKITMSPGAEQMIRVNRKTGEVILKFKLPLSKRK